MSKILESGSRFKFYPMRFILSLHEKPYPKRLSTGQQIALIEWLCDPKRDLKGKNSTIFGAYHFAGYRAVLSLPLSWIDLNPLIAQAVTATVLKDDLACAADQTVMITRHWENCFMRNTSEWLRKAGDGMMRLTKKWNEYHVKAVHICGISAVLIDGEWRVEIEYGYDESVWRIFLMRGTQSDPHDDNTVFFEPCTNEEFDHKIVGWMDENIGWVDGE